MKAHKQPSPKPTDEDEKPIRVYLKANPDGTVDEDDVRRFMEALGLGDRFKPREESPKKDD